jgi:HAD superfamily hydrolase (TIGR01509 family)
VVKGILFDLDGVLIHSTPIHRAAFEQVFRPFGIQDFQYFEYAGWKTVDVVEDVFRRHRLAASTQQISEVASEKSRIARELLDRDPPLDPDCGRVLAEIAAEYPMALASSGSRPSVDAFLRWSGADTLFGSVLSGDDVSRAKPDPESYVRSAESLSLAPAECLVVEDSVAGIQASRAMRAQALGMEGTSSEQALRDAGAVDVLKQLSELPGWLTQNDAHSETLGRSIDPFCWTAIVPAAGKGSRLGFHLPKILFPIAGRPILDWLLDIFAPICGRIVFVLSPEGAPVVRAALEERIPGRYDIVLQETPTGMGDAVTLGLPTVRTPHVAVVWGDQVALRQRSVELSLRIHQGRLQPDATCPTVLREHPYIHFERDAKGRVSSVRQAREGDAMPPSGESDTGFFCFRTAALKQHLSALRTSGEGRGTVTGEFNLLPVLPWIAQHGKLVTPRIMSLEETMGINSATDAAAVEPFLLSSDRRRSHGDGN